MSSSTQAFSCYSCRHHVCIKPCSKEGEYLSCLYQEGTSFSPVSSVRIESYAHDVAAKVAGKTCLSVFFDFYLGNLGSARKDESWKRLLGMTISDHQCQAQRPLLVLAQTFMQPVTPHIAY